MIRANDTRNRPSRSKALAAQVEAGTIIINDVIHTHGAAETTWFGVKESGLGITHSKHGLREFVRMKHINWDMMHDENKPLVVSLFGEARTRFEAANGIAPQMGVEKVGLKSLGSTSKM